MKFVRAPSRRTSLERLRSLGARDGWLVETPDVLRVGFGRVADTHRARGGLDATHQRAAALARHELVGDDGPAGTGVVAFGALPFDRDARRRA